jgi:hypothetical protein
MENIKIYEEFSNRPELDKFKNLRKGDLVKYMGTAYLVETPGDHELSLVDEDGNKKTVNFSMFKAKGMIVDI